MFSFTIHRHTLVCYAFVLLITSSVAQAEPEFQVVRVMRPQLADTLDTLYRVSPEVRAIIDELERSDLVVHVLGAGLESRPQFSGTMRFVHAAGGRRFLRITVHERLSPERQAAALAHELQHALEVARTPAVTDHTGFAALYRAIGYESGGDPNVECYETDAALQIGARALVDFRAAVTSVRRAQRSAANGSD